MTTMVHVGGLEDAAFDRADRRAGRDALFAVSPMSSPLLKSPGSAGEIKRHAAMLASANGWEQSTRRGGAAVDISDTPMHSVARAPVRRNASQQGPSPSQSPKQLRRLPKENPSLTLALANINLFEEAVRAPRRADRSRPGYVPQEPNVEHDGSPTVSFTHARAVLSLRCAAGFSPSRSRTARHSECYDDVLPRRF